MADEAKSIRRTVKARFTRKRNELLKSIDANQGREMVEDNYLKLTEAWDSKFSLVAIVSLLSNLLFWGSCAVRIIIRKLHDHETC